MIFQTIALQAAPSGGFGGMMLPMLALLVVFYLFMFLPQNKKRKNEKKFLAELKKGTKVVTSSGIHGKLIDINETEGTVTIETGAGKIRFERAAISVELSQKYLTPAPAKK